MKNTTKLTLTTLAALAGFTGAANAQLLYDADLSGTGVGFDHDNGANPPPAAGTQLSGPNWTIEAIVEPSTDSGGNIFGVFGNGFLEAADYGGEGLFFSDSIDVTGWNEVALDFDARGDFNTSSEFFQWEYSLDSATPVALGNVVGDTSGAVTLDQTISNLDVTGVSALVVGFRFDHNGGSDFIDVTGLQVDGVTAVPEPSAYALLAGMLGLGYVMVRRRRA